MKTQHKTLSEKLAENLLYYTKDPEKRRCIDGLGNCKYSGKTIGKDTTVGCFVGRLLPLEQRLLLDIEKKGAGVSKAVDYLNEKGYKIPSIIKNNIYLMRDFQYLHDECYFWYYKGLSGSGLNKLRYIIEKHNLDKSAFENILGIKL